MLKCREIALGGFGTETTPKQTLHLNLLKRKEKMLSKFKIDSTLKSTILIYLGARKIC